MFASPGAPVMLNGRKYCPVQVPELVVKDVADATVIFPQVLSSSDAVKVSPVPVGLMNESVGTDVQP
jgi:hypothetical protein